MSIAAALAPFARPLDGHRTDHRAHHRYPLSLDVEYKAGARASLALPRSGGRRSMAG